MSRGRRYAIVAVTILIAIVFATMIGGWYSTGAKRTRKRPYSMRQPDGASPAPKKDDRPVRQAKAASVAAAIAANGDAYETLPRFQRDRLWAPEKPAEVFPHSSAHGAEDFTTVDCVGGANPQTRTCRIYNACFDSELDNHGAESRSRGPARGKAHPPPPPRLLQGRTRTRSSSSRATPTPSRSGSWTARASPSRAAASSCCGTGRSLMAPPASCARLCARDASPPTRRVSGRAAPVGEGWRASLAHASSAAGPAQVLKWYDEPLAMFGRHYPDNYAHAVSAPPPASWPSPVAPSRPAARSATTGSRSGGS